MGDITQGVVHQGKVVAKYRDAKGWSQADLAEALEVDLRTVQRMEKQPVIKNPQRRALLVGLLGIPLILIGLDTQPKHIAQISLTPNPDLMAFLESELDTRWDIFHTGGTTRASQGLDVWMQELRNFAHEAGGTIWHKRAQTTLNMSYQLKGSIQRDLMCYESAHHAYEEAWHVAKELGDPELMASTLARRGVTSIQQQKPDAALIYLDRALALADGSGLPCLRGYILQALSESHAVAQRANESKRYADLAQRALERRGEVLERSHCTLTTTSVTSQRGVNAVWLHENEYAIALIDRGLSRYDPTLVRGRARLIAQKAEAYFGLGLIDLSVSTAEEALMLARSVGSQKTAARIQSLHSLLQASKWRKERSVARLGALLIR
jgi:tetratricopeptide (TPR) repeat protein